MSEFDDLVEVYTDKLVAKIPSTADGVVTAIEYGEDDVCQVGHALLTIDTDGPGETQTVEVQQPAPPKQESAN